MYRKADKSIYNYMYTYTFQMLCIGLHVACIPSKFCQSCLCNKKRLGRQCIRCLLPSVCVHSAIPFRLWKYFSLILSFICGSSHASIFILLFQWKTYMIYVLWHSTKYNTESSTQVSETWGRLPGIGIRFTRLDCQRNEGYLT